MLVCVNLCSNVARDKFGLGIACSACPSCRGGGTFQRAVRLAHNNDVYSATERGRINVIVEVQQSIQPCFRIQSRHDESGC